MTVLGNSEFVLTIFGALAQEESANTSKRVKFGKKLNAEKGRVPNIVYGYDKTIGDYFNLEINAQEADVVQQIYQWYLKEGYGAAKIAKMLNEKGFGQSAIVFGRKTPYAVFLPMNYTPARSSTANRK